MNILALIHLSNEFCCRTSWFSNHLPIWKNWNLHRITSYFHLNWGLLIRTGKCRNFIANAELSSPTHPPPQGNVNLFVKELFAHHSPNENTPARYIKQYQPIDIPLSQTKFRYFGTYPGVTTKPSLMLRFLTKLLCFTLELRWRYTWDMKISVRSSWDMKISVRSSWQIPRECSRTRQTDIHTGTTKIAEWSQQHL